MMRAADSFVARFSPDALKMTFVSDVGTESTAGIDKVTGKNFKERLAYEAELISSQVLGGRYHFTNYRQLLMVKGPAECPRELCIPTVRDKLTLKALSQVLDDVYGDRCLTPSPQPIVSRLKLRLRDKRFDRFIKFDIERFYASISHETLLRILRRRIRKASLLSLVEEAISTPSVEMGKRERGRKKRGVPEGLPVSNRLANIYVRDIDAAFESEENLEYFRYVDDIVILCSSESVERTKRKMERLVRKLGLALNPAKTQTGFVGKTPCEYLGYVFHVDAVVPRRKSILNLEKWLEDHMRSWSFTANKFYWAWKLNLRITGCRITEDGKLFHRYGWLFYFSQSTDAALPHRLDGLVQKLARRYGVELPDSLSSFSKCYYEIHFRNGIGSRIPLIDFSTSTEEKVGILTRLYGSDIVADLDEDEIARLFRRRMIWEAKSLERDVGSFS